MTPREQFEATFSALTEEQRRDVRLCARPFEWTTLTINDRGVHGTHRGVLDGYWVWLWTVPDTATHGFCVKCYVKTWCRHTLALATLYYGGHPMKTITGRQGDGR